MLFEDTPLLFTDLKLDHRLQKQLALKSLTEATPIQSQAIPLALQGKDLLASSKTGSGKTFAFLIPALHRVFSQKALSKKDARILILAPTRELAKQVFNELLPFIKSTNVNGALLLGGENFNDQVKALRKSPQFVVGTPGRVADHLADRSLFLNGLEMLILDEADRMLDLGFYEQLTKIDAAADHRKRQTLMFSATLHSAQFNKLTRQLLNAPTSISVDEANKVNPDVTQRFLFSDGVSHKEELLKSLLENEQLQQAIIFTATRDDTTRLAELLQSWNINSVALSGELLQSKRNQVMQDFERHQYKILVTTDLASRGLDLPNVSLVMNFDLPKTVDEYVHRVGRTARAGNKGTSISLVGPKDWRTFEMLKRILKQDFNFETIAGLDATFKGRVTKKRPQKDSTKPSNKNVWKKPSPKKKKTVVVDTMQGEETGFGVLKRKKT